MQQPAATVCNVTCMLLVLIAHMTVQGTGRSWQSLLTYIEHIVLSVCCILKDCADESER